MSVLCVGCTHELEVLNLEDYAHVSLVGPRIDIAIAPQAASKDSRIYRKAVVDALRKHPHVGLVRTHWTRNTVTEDRFNPAYVIDITVTPKYKSSKWNFLIAWPCGLIFMPSWNGFAYTADIASTITFQPASGAEEVFKQDGQEATVPPLRIRTPFSMRHCDFARGFWSEFGTWTFWSVPGAIAGVVIGNVYDVDATRPFHVAADETYGTYVANEIVKALVERGAVRYSNR